MININSDEQVQDLGTIGKYESFADLCCGALPDTFWKSLFGLTLPALLLVQQDSSDDVEVLVIDCEMAETEAVEWASEAEPFEIAVAIGHLDDGDFAPDWMGYAERSRPGRVN